MDKMNKKGLFGTDMIQWMIRIVYLTVVVFVCALLINMAIKNDVEIYDAEMDLFYQRMIYTPNGFMETINGIDRTIVGTIDLDKFIDAENILGDSINYGKENNYVAAKMLLLTNINYTSYYNEQKYHMWKPFVDVKGFGGSLETYRRMNVIVNNNGTLSQSMLHVNIVTPKS